MQHQKYASLSLPDTYEHNVSLDKNTLKEISTIFLEPFSVSVWWFSSYLFPDGRAQNPDLTGLCEPSPQDHIKVTQVSLSWRPVRPTRNKVHLEADVWLSLRCPCRSSMSFTVRWAPPSSSARSVQRTTRTWRSSPADTWCARPAWPPGRWGCRLQSGNLYLPVLIQIWLWILPQCISTPPLFSVKHEHFLLSVFYFNFIVIISKRLSR